MILYTKDVPSLVSKFDLNNFNKAWITIQMISQIDSHMQMFLCF